MYFKLWGTRGSLPRAMSSDHFLELVSHYAMIAKREKVNSIDSFLDFLKKPDFQPLTYGGHTICTEVGDEVSQRFCYIDCGSGLASAGDDAMNRGIKEFHIFQTHAHWDHLMGLPFFIPVFLEGYQITIYHVHKTIPDSVKNLFNGVNFPVSWNELKATINFKQLKLYESFELGELKVRPFALDHPGGCFGYRFDDTKNSIAIGVDGEYKRFTPEELGKDHEFYQNLDALIFDGQYELEELASHFDWGHSSPQIGVELALREGIRNLIVTHHDPRSTEFKTFDMIENARQHLLSHLDLYRIRWEELGQPNGPNVLPAFDGMYAIFEDNNLVQKK